MKLPTRLACAAIGQSALWIALVLSAEAQPPRYNNPVPIPAGAKLNPKDFESFNIDLTNAKPSTSVTDANAKFSARAAAAVFYAAHDETLLIVPNDPDVGHICHVGGIPVPIVHVGGHCNEMNFGHALLAKMAYEDYFDDFSQGETYRTEVYRLLMDERSGRIGTSVDDDQKHSVPGTVRVGPDISHGEYDVLLQSYIALYYKYYNVLPPAVRSVLLRRLLTVNGPFPFKNSEEYLFFHFDKIVVDHFFCYTMLYLYPCIHFHEIKVTVLIY